jgi:hypothetical protein
MSLTKKNDVKNHLLSRYQKRLHLDIPDSVPHSILYLEPVPTLARITSTEFSQDFLAEHSSSQTAVPSADYEIAPTSSLPPAVFKSARV